MEGLLDEGIVESYALWRGGGGLDLTDLRVPHSEMLCISELISRTHSKMILRMSIKGGLAIEGEIFI